MLCVAVSIANIQEFNYPFVCLFAQFRSKNLARAVHDIGASTVLGLQVLFCWLIFVLLSITLSE